MKAYHFDGKAEEDFVEIDIPSDLVELVLTLGSIMTSSALGISEDEAREKLKINLNNGDAYEKFLELIKAQNGSLNLANKAKIYPLKARKNGYVTEIDAYGLGEISRSIGAGRKEKTDVIDKYVGFILNKKIGDYVEKGEELLRIYITDSDVEVNKILNCFTIKKEQVKPNPLIYDIISLA
jgi:thymidine phosphorylase